MLKQKKVDTLVLSGTRTYINRYNSEFYIEQAISKGAEPRRLKEIRHDAWSTMQEAQITTSYFRGVGADTVLIITSPFHTRRAKEIFNYVAEGKPYYQVVGVIDPLYHPENWIYDRSSASIWFIEWTKTLFAWGEQLFLEQPLIPKVDWSHWVHRTPSQEFEPILSQVEELAPSDSSSSFQDTTLQKDSVSRQ